MTLLHNSGRFFIGFFLNIAAGLGPILFKTAYISECKRGEVWNLGIIQ